MKHIGKLLQIVIFALALATFAIGYEIWSGQRRPVPLQLRSLGPTVTQLERIGELTTTRVHVTDVLFAEGEGYRGSWLIKGDALLACDMSKAKIVKIDADKRIATIRLPPLRVISARIDHSKTKTWSVEKTSWLPWNWGDQEIVHDTAMFHAQRLVETAAVSQQHLGSAKTQAELLIRQIYDYVEWKVEVQWE